MKMFILIMALLHTVITVSAQPTPLDTYFSQVRAGVGPIVPNELFKTENINPAVEKLPTYLSDTTALIRERAYFRHTLVRNEVAVGSYTSALRAMVAGSLDKNSGNAGAALTYLASFSIFDFTKRNKDSLQQMLDPKHRHLESIAKLVGFLQLKDSQENLFALSQDPSLGRKERWACMLALARMNMPLPSKKS